MDNQVERSKEIINGIIGRARAKLKEDNLNSQQDKTNENICPICGGTGFIITRHEHSQDSVTFCNCRKVSKAKFLQEVSGITSENLKHFTFANYNPYNVITKGAKIMALNYVRDYEKIKNNRNNSAALLGQVGSGKTHLSIAMGINFLNKSIPVIYMPYRDTIINIKQNILDEEYYNKTLNKYKTGKILIIDDLFKGKITESDLNIMFEIINYRYLNNFPIIISSELTKDKLLDVDESIGSRIIEMCKNYTTEIVGKNNNYRLK